MMTYPAQIVFLVSERLDQPLRWKGRLLRGSAAVDRVTGKPVRGTPIFNIEERQNGSCHVVMQGGHRGGRRYATYANVTEAQKAGIRWAGRRFRIPVGVP